MDAPASLAHVLGMIHNLPGPPPSDAWHAARRGLSLKCPNCGGGRLFDGYLKQAPACSVCRTPTGDIRADDGPAWATILLVGHLISPVFFVFALAKTELQKGLALTLVLSLVLGLMALLLPRMKGLFIALIWKTGATGEETSEPKAAPDA